MAPSINLTTSSPPFSERLHRAMDYAAVHHRKQIRKDPDVDIPYLSHLFGVAYILASYGFPEDVLVAGLLHDFIEDVVEKKRKPKLGAEMKSLFGDSVYNLVSLVTHTKRDARGKEVPWEVRTHTYIERLSSPSTPAEAKAISCADKIHNLQSLLLALGRNPDEPQKMWGKLKRSPQVQLEKFKRLHDGISKHWQHPIVNDLQDKIDHLERILSAN